MLRKGLAEPDFGIPFTILYPCTHKRVSDSKPIRTIGQGMGRLTEKRIIH